MRRCKIVTVTTVTKPTVFLFTLIILLLIMYVEILGQETTVTDGNTTQKVLKYILAFSGDAFAGAAAIHGRTEFSKRKCSYDLCFLSYDRTLLPDITNFDAVLFHGPVVPLTTDVPIKRSNTQVYLFWTLESPQKRPVINKLYDNFFNWTCTYRLDSDLVLTYMLVRDYENKVIGPSPIMDWISDDEMLPINDVLKNKLKSKYKAAAWVVSHCRTNGKREQFVHILMNEMKKYNLTLDIYGLCGKKLCENCWEKIESDYYFYLAFENSFGRDYVTEKVLNPLKHYTVPIVYGTANYSRFMPSNAYIDALELGAKKLAKEMKDIIDNKERYYSFFRWHNHYSYHSPEEDPSTDYFCRLCAALHYGVPSRTKDNFIRWWNGERLTQLLTRNCSDRECFYK